MIGVTTTVYEEKYKDYAIEIIECTGGSTADIWYEFEARLLADMPDADWWEPMEKLDCYLPEEFDKTLVEARAQCDREIEESKKLEAAL